MALSPATATTSARSALTGTVLALGVVSLLTDAASDMIWPLLPIFLVEHLHRSVAYVGLIEGIAEGTAAVGKYLAGRYADRVHRRKPLVLLGYTLSSVARPLLALAMSPWQALAIRFTDRVGKGIRGAPRDALLAAGVPPERRSLAFGFHRAMDNLGAVIGPVLATVFLWARPDDLRVLFALSVIPGALSVVAIVVMVREVPPVPAMRPVEALHAGAAVAQHGVFPNDAAGDPRTAALGPQFRAYLSVVALFALANASDFFLVARARDVGVPLRYVPVLWGALSLLRTVAAVPGGWLADRWGRRRSLALGWLLYAVAYALFGIASRPWTVVIALLIYGTYYGLTEGSQNALVAALVPREALGRAYGTFALVTGLLAIPASGLFGLLLRIGDGRYAFFGSAAVAACAGLVMTRLVPKNPAVQPAASVR